MTGNNRDRRPLELYLHIPFCVRKCQYCDFLSGPADVLKQEQYMEALLTEIKGRSREYREYEVETVFFGGGTPSVVEGKWILRVMETIADCYQLSEDAEITMELNPGTVDMDKLLQYKRAGINRLSIGLQSACDVELKGLGRIHSFADFLKTYADARKAGFHNINVDVMSGLPGQTKDSFLRTLEALTGLEPMPEHISAYSLIIEENTPFYELWEQGKLELPDEDTERQMYALTKDVLAAKGFFRYEISNYAREGYECRHNCGYWQRREYLGFGIGAASLMGECRFRNGQSLEAYLAAPLSLREEFQQLTGEDRMEEFMFLGLRLARGVSEKEFCRIFGLEMTQVYGDVLDRNLADGLLAVREVCLPKEAAADTEGTDRYYYLTDRGMDVSNHVMAQFLF